MAALSGGAGADPGDAPCGSDLVDLSGDRIGECAHRGSPAGDLAGHVALSEADFFKNLASRGVVQEMLRHSKIPARDVDVGGT
jgi:hypothetical protein